LQTPAFNKDVYATSTAEPETIWADTSEPLTSNAGLASSVDTPPSSVTDFITPDMISPLQYGDLADLGLISWTPAGLIRWSLEVMQVSTGTPWFWTIVAGTVFWRLVLLPLSIKGSQNVARMTIHAPELEAAKKRLNAASSKRKADLEQAIVGMRDAYAKAGISPGSMFLVQFVQLPIMIGLFFAIKGMCEHPVEQLRHSGFDFLPDLTAITSVADPYFILSIIMMAAMNFQIKVCEAIHVSFLC
jgi:YidC/Oxa1 family membrane protein insertase